MSSQHSPVLPVAFPEEALIFRVGHDDYGVGIAHVQEVRSYEPPLITNEQQPSEERPSHFLGLLNVRGTPLPLIDLRVRDKLEAPYNTFTVIIVVSTRDGKHQAGFVVDSVSNVIDIPREKILPPNEHDRARGLIKGRVDVGNRRIFLVDLDEEIQRAYGYVGLLD